MSNRREADEALLIDFLRGEASDGDVGSVQARLQQDDEFRKLRDDLSHTFAAIDRMPEIDPPADLVDRTMWRVRVSRQTDQLLADEQSRRRTFLPTFSIRELGALAAAVVLFAVILVPSLREARQTYLATACQSQAGQIGTALGNYAADHDGHLPIASASTARWLPDGDTEAVVSNSQGLFKLIKGGYAAPGVFQCPAGDGKPFTVRAGMTDFPGNKCVSYSYQHSLGPHVPQLDEPPATEVSERMAILADNNPVFDGGRFVPDNVDAATSHNHGGRGQSVLYLDRHVEWTQTPNVGVDADNIFLAGGLRSYSGTETPVGRTDTFLLPAYSGQ